MYLVLPQQFKMLSGKLLQIIDAANQVGFDLCRSHIGFHNEAKILILEKKAEIFEELTTSELVQHSDNGLAVSRLKQVIELDVQFKDKKLVISLEYPHCHQNQFNFNPRSICIGLDVKDQLHDVWHAQDQAYTISYPIDFKMDLEESLTHLAWLLVCLLLEFPIEDSLVIARAGISSMRNTDDMQLSWPLDINDFPNCELMPHKAEPSYLAQEPSLPFAPLAQPLGLYPVVDDVSWIERLLNLGVKTLQLRIKDPNQPDLSVQIQRAVELGRQHQAQVFINDYWQLAIEHGAYGVHLGQEDILTADLAAIAEADVRLGLSTHGYFEIIRAKQCFPSYIALGHIFPTTTKQMPSKPQGLARLKLYHQLIANQCPTVAIGGIDLQRAPDVYQTGVDSLAVVRAITQASDIQYVLSKFEHIMQARTE
ncbi:MAG: thiamine phosphate synthase [Vibrio sp.]